MQRDLPLVEAKWLSPLGAGLHGLNQVQRSVALALWFKERLPETEVTYMVCSKTGREADDNLKHYSNDSSWEGMPGDFFLPMTKFISQLADRVLEAHAINLCCRSWGSLGEAVSREPMLSEVGDFLRHHGQGRMYRGRPATLIKTLPMAP